MVSALETVRFATSQALLKALRDTETEAESAGSLPTPMAGILREYGIDTAATGGAAGTQSLSALLTGLSPQKVSGTTLGTAVGSVTAPVAPISTDITTASFMTGLAGRIVALADAPDTKAQGQAMAKALKAGTLTVADPLTGRAVAAFSPDKQQTGTASEIGASGWSDYLKDHLKRGEDGTFLRSRDGSYIDAATGANAWFGTVGSGYVYLTWPAASTGTAAAA
ncbi:hypothetical protein SAMN05880582_10648 [Rhizobium sp. RU20A]|uniref:hypothetical protein n=1 Tax=Rhizobium sp. RU20A TaxID=1907412 RepID=UPI000953F9F1|nr:hypothetical protein [Rhizobium sp. RU20A]SIR06613.1 hypothetical protein SAMN05880582_10648 [Rhizobium sp. RU20A]